MEHLVLPQSALSRMLIHEGVSYGDLLRFVHRRALPPQTTICVVAEGVPYEVQAIAAYPQIDASRIFFHDPAYRGDTPVATVGELFGPDRPDVPDVPAVVWLEHGPKMATVVALEVKEHGDPDHEDDGPHVVLRLHIDFDAFAQEASADA